MEKSGIGTDFKEGLNDVFDTVHQDAIAFMRSEFTLWLALAICALNINLIFSQDYKSISNAIFQREKCLYLLSAIRL